jgi:scyllo-inositol 2-dehydrogenase (NADP+)
MISVLGLVIKLYKISGKISQSLQVATIFGRFLLVLVSDFFTKQHKMINVGMIGYGLSGRYLQAPFFEHSGSFRLKTIYTRSGQPTEHFPQVQHVTELEPIFSDPSIGLITICSPSYTHFEFAERALLAGKHVLVEKPFTATMAQAQALFDLAQQKNLVITAFQNRRFDSDFLTLQKVLKSGKLGEILHYEARYDRYKPVLNPKKWKEVVQPANGILYDLGSHLLDQALSIFGAPKTVWGQKYTQREGSDIDDAFEIRLDYGRAKVKLSASLLVKKLGPRYVINGTKGTFTKYGLDPQEDHSKEGQKPSDPTFGYENPADYGELHYEANGQDYTEKIPTERGNWAAFFENLASAIAGNSSPDIKPEHILEQMRIIELVELCP